MRIFADGELLGEASADQPRADLVDAAVGDGAHSFSFPVPPETLRAGEVVRLSAYDVATGLQIGGVREVEIPAAAPLPLLLHGNIDHVTNDGWVSGWCWYPADPSRHPELVVTANGVEAGRADAADMRVDLARAGIGDGSHGFTFALPWEILSRGGEISVAVRDAATGQQVGSDAVVRVGAQVETEDRVAALERHVAMLRGELETFLRERQERDENRAARDLFRTVAAFFAELAEASTPQLAGIGLRGALAAFADNHPPIVLAVPVHPVATVLIGGDAVPSAIYRCIAALHAAGTDAVADVVVVDDGGHGGEAALLPTVVRNLRYYRVPHGRALLAGYGEAIRDARGAVVVCMSAHVRPEPGCIIALARTFDDEPEAVVVGAQIARVDGTAEYVGDALSPDLRRHFEGRDEPADRPEWGYMRSVETVDSRLFAIRSGVGWAENYRTLDAAAIELCLAARARGGAVLYQPAARAVLSTDAAAQDAADVEDLEALRMRWQVTLPGPRDVGHALVVDTTLPTPDRDAGSVLVVAVMQILRRLGWRVTFCPADGSFDNAEAAAALERRGIGLARPPRYGSITAFLSAYGDQIGLLLACRHMHAAMLMERARELLPRARVVFMPIDLHYLREGREAALAGRAAPPLTREAELDLVRQADATLVHSDYEQKLLSEHTDPERVHLLRWVAHPVLDPAPFERRRGLCFVGGFQHAPNVDAVLWFVSEVMPLLREANPALTLHVIGADPPATVQDLASDNVVVHGWVEHLAEFLGATRLTVAPLRFGAGFKGKIATSMERGVPVVATALALEGTGLRDGDGVTLADTPQNMARAILQLHDEPGVWAGQSARALERCAALYAPEHARDAVSMLLSELNLPVG
ncbi:MAG: glycosyltransferase [Acidisphaera sp.]|nr:glycosyltransferase [Acidisphaera sp.]